ncbi:FAD binding domain-containing protein [Hirsutella rhossiliensis]|uniref:FAD binding domain-containing protein n=1 Tax=Hirsutella rhossiliensis TaxID=111463 RepID=A0A9P8SKD0_9HYPO|nr:FAD binding domain-containing protein [Hirsutella rhossiliensis]KAH0964011.1 FAD binding domain-containing protein [Hirsutella rhossiliensis]
MKGPGSLVYGLAILQTLAAGARIPGYFYPPPTTPVGLDAAQVQRELGSLVSDTTAIFGPDDNRYQNATARWNNFARPQIQVVVQPGEECDVSTIVEYCNENSIEFLAHNGGHGSTHSLGQFNGIQINMGNLRNITIQPSGETAWFQGGVHGGPTTRYLWDQGYVTTTGSCDCVGLMGAILGGGHGRHEGLYGMGSDNLRQLNVVLANGTAIRVNKTSHGDLFWAMKGAGHNFGIVTSFEMVIYPRGPDSWHYHNYIWRGDKLEDLFNALNAFHGNGTTPVNMTTNFGNFLMNNTITEEEPVIFWTFAYRGSAEEAEQHLAPFNAIEAVYDESGDVPYPQISVAQETDENAFICQRDSVRITATAGLQVYNVTAEHQIYQGFQDRVASNPRLAAGGSILHEGYSTEAVTAQDPDNSAYPFRADHHLNLVQIIIPPGDSSLEQAAQKWATEVRDQWNNGQPGRSINAYVNYANGFEPVESIYGHERWRLERLRDLKGSYDSFNRFRYFNPIVGGDERSKH